MNLTKRELQVVNLLVRGFKTRNIAALLGVTDATITRYICSAMRKTGVHKRAYLIQIYDRKIEP